MPPWCEPYLLPLSAVASPPLCSDAQPALMDFPAELANQDVVEALIKVDAFEDLRLWDVVLIPFRVQCLNSRVDSTNEIDVPFRKNLTVHAVVLVISTRVMSDLWRSRLHSWMFMLTSLFSGVSYCRNSVP